MNLRMWQRLRSVRGQLILLGVTFAGAVVVAGIVLGLRGAVFEHYVREKYQPDDEARDTARVLADPASTPEQVAAVGKKLDEKIQPGGQPPRQNFGVLDRLYGVWVLDEVPDPDGNLARRLTQLQPDWVFRRLRVTLVAGSPAQQARALVWLRHVAGGDHAERVEELAAYALRKAERRGDVELKGQAAAVLALGQPRADGRYPPTRCPGGQP